MKVYAGRANFFLTLNLTLTLTLSFGCGSAALCRFVVESFSLRDDPRHPWFHRRVPIRIAIIEDHAMTREALVVLFNGTSGYTCASTHASAEDALEKLRLKEVDLVLVDIGLPRLSGIDCVRQIKTQRSDLPALMYTVSEDAEQIFLALQAGADGYILKRAPYPELFAAISDVRAGGAPMSRAIAAKVLRYFHKQGQAVAEVTRLTERERQILTHLSDGKSYKETGKALHISPETVRTHLRNICEKLHVSSRTEALVKFARARPA